MIPYPTLLSHQKDGTLLTSDTTVKEFITCFDPSTCVRGSNVYSTSHKLTPAGHTQYLLETLPLLSAAEVAEQIETAHRASKSWAKTTFAQRKMFLQSLKAWVLRDMDGIVRVACRDTGKTSGWGGLGWAETDWS